MNLTTEKIAAILVLTLFSTGCAYKLVHEGRLNEPMVDEIKEKVALQRGLPFKDPVHIELISREQAAEFFRRELTREYPPGKIARLNRAYLRMGLIDEGVDLENTVLNFYSNNVAGFYDHRAKKLYVVEEAASRFSLFSFILQRDLNAEMIIAHELTHALDDQHFDLLSHEETMDYNDDAALAVRALEEGIATIVGFAVLYYPRLSLDEIMASLSGSSGAAEKLMRSTAGDVPVILIDMVVFTYLGGASFVSKLYLYNEGWGEINRAYSNPPRSSEEVLYPEKYLDRNDPPVNVELAVDPGSFGKDWIMLDENTMGAIGVFSMLRRFIDSRKAKLAADGWGGDRYVALGRDGGENALLIWVTEWDTEPDADEFFRAYGELLGEKYRGLKPVECPVGGGDCFVDSNGELIRIARAGKRVTIIEGADENTLPTAVKYSVPTLLVKADDNCGRVWTPGADAIMVSP